MLREWIDGVKWNDNGFVLWGVTSHCQVSWFVWCSVVLATYIFSYNALLLEAGKSLAWQTVDMTCLYWHHCIIWILYQLGFDWFWLSFHSMFLSVSGLVKVQEKCLRYFIPQTRMFSKLNAIIYITVYIVSLRCDGHLFSQHSFSNGQSPLLLYHCQFSFWKYCFPRNTKLFPVIVIKSCSFTNTDSLNINVVIISGDI